jgi:hypothetical protein
MNLTSGLCVRTSHDEWIEILSRAPVEFPRLAGWRTLHVAGEP